VHGHLPFLDYVLDVSQFDFLGIKRSSGRAIYIMTEKEKEAKSQRQAAATLPRRH
jgi:hypothetical protein